MLVVAAALLDEKGQVLVQRRPAGRPMAGLWEFPGGKVEPDEYPEQALVRELAEELAIVVAPDVLTPLGFATAAGGNGHLVLLLFGCRAWAGEPRALHASAIAWHAPAALAALPMLPADIPLVAQLVRLLGA